MKPHVCARMAPQTPLAVALVAGTPFSQDRAPGRPAAAATLSASAHQARELTSVSALAHLPKWPPHGFAAPWFSNRYLTCSPSDRCRLHCDLGCRERWPPAATTELASQCRRCWCRATAEAATNGASSSAVPEPVVKIDNETDPFATIVSIEFGDRLGELLDTVGPAAGWLARCCQPTISRVQSPLPVALPVSCMPYCFRFANYCRFGVARSMARLGTCSFAAPRPLPPAGGLPQGSGPEHPPRQA